MQEEQRGLQENPRTPRPTACLAAVRPLQGMRRRSALSAAGRAWPAASGAAADDPAFQLVLDLADIAGRLRTVADAKRRATKKNSRDDCSCPCLCAPPRCGPGPDCGQRADWPAAQTSSIAHGCEWLTRPENATAAADLLRTRRPAGAGCVGVYYHHCLQTLTHARWRNLTPQLKRASQSPELRPVTRTGQHMPAPPCTTTPCCGLPSLVLGSRWKEAAQPLVRDFWRAFEQNGPQHGRRQTDLMQAEKYEFEAMQRLSTSQ